MILLSLRLVVKWSAKDVSHVCIPTGPRDSSTVRRLLCNISNIAWQLVCTQWVANHPLLRDKVVNWWLNDEWSPTGQRLVRAWSHMVNLKLEPIWVAECYTSIGDRYATCGRAGKTILWSKWCFYYRNNQKQVFCAANISLQLLWSQRANTNALLIHPNTYQRFVCHVQRCTKILWWFLIICACVLIFTPAWPRH